MGVVPIIETAVREALRESRRASKLAGHDWDVADAFEAIKDFLPQISEFNVSVDVRDLSIPGVTDEDVDDLLEAISPGPTVLEVAVAWVEAISSHPNNWAGDEDMALIRAVRAHNPSIECKWLSNPEYDGWIDFADPNYKDDGG